MYSCDEKCGWVASFVACLAFGSFAIPIKGRAANQVQIDPLVMQSYKTAMCFLTCWIVLLFGEKFTFSPWGIVSGIIWVPGGTAGIFAVRNAGLAISQGIWSSMKVLVAFIWGIFIFNESVQSRIWASAAVFLMCIGLFGMSYFSAPENGANKRNETAPNSHPINRREHDYMQYPWSFKDDVESRASDYVEMEALRARGWGGANMTNELDPLSHDLWAEEPHYEEICTTPDSQVEGNISFCGLTLTRRQLGLLCAALGDGVWGGSILVPMHFSRDDTKGLGFVISFSIGASIVTLFLWIIRYAYHVNRTRSMKESFDALPSFHLSVMWAPGSLAGLLWSIGNVSSMLSVQYLGEGVGFSIIQSQMLVAGLWGVFWFREISGVLTISKWFASAFITLVGIILLSYEHVH
mmetsp:Transcript_8026/g.14469  ORF Transcript_8026/g.14469 Transcript_8026/m.14469 type:complete len:408 (-) Transcript_8026:896-2119(-)